MPKAKKKKSPWNLNQKVTAAIRKIWRTSPMRLRALELACVTPDNKNYAKTYECSCCHGVFLAQQVQVDHVMDEESQESWDEFIQRIFLDTEKITYEDTGEEVCCLSDGSTETLSEIVVGKLSVVCIPCHNRLTKERKKCKSPKKKPTKRAS